MNFKSKLSFNKSEFQRSTLNLNNSGISIPIFDSKEIKSKFGLTSNIESFGFFGGTSDSNKFYPGLNVADDIIPKPEDFIKVPFRLLSATVVAAGSWKATDFSDETMLRASLSKLKRKPIYFDHDTDLLNWVGIIEDTSWGEANDDVPGGINGLLAIDAKTNPKIARGVLIQSIFSNSVTVEFNWRPSHYFDSIEEFQDKLGTLDASDGKMVTRIVTEILDYHETSLVWLGADPYAKLIGEDGNLINIDQASAYSYEKEEIKNKYEKNNSYAISFSMPKEVIGLSKIKTSNTKQINMKDEVQLSLKKLLGLSDSDQINLDHLRKLSIKDESLDSKLEEFNKLVSVNEKGETIELSNISENSHFIISKENFDSMKTSLESLDQLTKDSEIAKAYLDSERSEVERLYKLSVDNKSEEAIINLIKKASKEELDAFKKQYTKTSTSKFTGKCKSCGSDDFQFRSSVEDGDGEEDTVKSASYEDLMDKFGTPKMNLIKN